MKGRQTEDFIIRAREWHCRNRKWQSRYNGATLNVRRYLDLTFARRYGESVKSENRIFRRIGGQLAERLRRVEAAFTAREWDEVFMTGGSRLVLARAA